MGENRDIFNGIPENSVVLNAVNISEELLQEHSSVIENRNNWHAFLIHNVKRTERNAILKIVLDHVYPEALLPSLFQSRGTDCIFLARNCSGAIGILLKNKLVIPDPSDRTWFYTCEIILMYSTISKLPLPSNNISKILELLYDEKSKILNLTNFSDNKDLSEYSPLSQPKLLCFALHLSDELKPSHIKLNDNEIRTLSPFVVLKGKSSLQKLDLRNNLIEDLEELNYLNNNLVELWLDGNPVCAKYDAFTYIKIVKKTLPMLEKLDGVSIGAHEFPVSQQFFFCNNEGFDLVDQFVSHFYSLYDNERKLLIDLYHPRAIFSMTTGNSKRSRTIERLQVYREFSRNIMSLMSPSKSVAIGNKKIFNVLLKLPKTEHNIPGFSVDMIYYTESSAVISITGTFVEDLKRNIQPDFVFDFKRTFTIIKRSSDYVIYNDILHVDIASDQAKNHEVDVTAHRYRECEKRMAQEAMSRVTGVDKEWVKRLLEDADYKINKFLKSFMSLLKQNKIPELAYSQNSEHSLMEWLIPKMEEYGLEKFESSLQKEAQEYIRKTRSSQKMSSIPSISNQKRECSKIPENASTNVIKTPYNSDNSNHISEYPEKKSQIIPKNTYKRNLIEIEKTDFIEFETKPEIKSREEIVDITSTSGTSKCAAVDDTDKNPMNNPQGHKRKASVPVSDTSKRKKKVIVTDGENTGTNSSELDVKKSKKNENLSDEDGCEIKITPTYALLNAEWINVREHDEYDFHLAFNKWILVQKDKEGKFSSKQDDFQKNFTCWKKHFPTYPNEILNHSLHSSCLNKKLKSALNGIKHPVTYWDFPATVPYDIRPPKKAIFEGGNVKKSISPDSGYGFVSVRNKWVLVTKNTLDLWVTPNNEKKVTWKGNGWVLEQLTTREKDLMEKREHVNTGKETTETLTHPSKSENTNLVTNTEIHEIDRKKMTGRNIQDTLFVCEDEDIEIAPEDLDMKKKIELEELKTIYTEDTEKEKTITNSDLHLLQTGDKENTPQPIAKREETMNKWKKIFKFVPYVPKLALIEGYWTSVCHKSDLKFHKTHLNDWILLEKNSETNKWCEVNDDFCLDKEASTQEEKLKNLGKYVFDHIPMPVTVYDFPSSVPMQVRPPKTLLINRKNLEVTPDSDYAYVSVRGQWIAVRRDAKLQWAAVDAKHEAAVKKKLANMPLQSTHNQRTVVEVDKKISSVTCTPLQLITGVKLEKPLTHWDVEGPEGKRPPKLALTEINGEQRWCYVSTSCGKGFVLEDGVWVKVVPAEPGQWKATEFSAYPGCIVGYYLFNNIWVTMKKFVLGGKWTPISDLKTSPTTYWNHVGPEETKPPKKIYFGETEKIIHNNSDMGFVMKEGAWVLMAREGNIWKTVKENGHFFICKRIDGIWRIIVKDAEDKWFYNPIQQKIFTFDNFNGLKKYAPPRQVSLFIGGEKIKKIIDEQSGLGFVLNKGVWVLKQLKDGKLVPVKDSKGKTNFGYKQVDGKFKIIRKDKKGEWIEPNKTKNEKQSESTSLDRLFRNAVPLTHDRILIDVQERLKPPKHALLKDIKKNNLTWSVINENSGFGFIRDDDTWLLMKWIVDGNWVDTFDEVEYRYKIIDNSWNPVKKENNVWVPIFDPKTTPKIPELCVESPEKDLPNKILMNMGHIKSKINITPSGTMGFLEMSDKYVLVKKMSSGKLFLFESAKNAVVFKQNITGSWIFSTPPITSFETDSNKIENLEEIKTYANTEGTILTKPPQYVKIMEGRCLKWKEIDLNNGYGFVRRKYWKLVKKTEDNWRIVNKSEGYDIIDNRWVLMQNTNNQWLPAFDPHLTPRCSLDSVGDSIFPIRVITYKNGEVKYINTAHDCSLAFTVCAPSICMLMKQDGKEWINMQDDFEEAPTMAFKLIDCKWRRMKKDTKSDQWLPCSKQFNLPVLHIDVIGDKSRQPPSNIRIVIPGNKNKEYNMSFNVFSEEGFVQEDGLWVLQKPTRNGWIKHPGVFGACGFQVVNNELSVFNKIDGEWEVYGESKTEKPMEIPIVHPVTYKEIALWPEQEKPPMDMLVFQHSEHMLLPNECTCNYGFVKHKDVWVVVKKNKDTWEVQKKDDEFFAYKLIGNRWVSMKTVRGKHWGPKGNQPSNSPQTYIDTFGTFEQKPPLRIVLNGDKWKVILNNEKFGFTKKNDMWVVMLKTSNLNWKEWTPKGINVGYKILDGQWTKFTKSLLSSKWIISKHNLPVLSCDFIPGDKNAPPSSLNFGYLSKCSPFKKVSLEPGSGKGFLKDNGAWVLMQKHKNNVTELKRFKTFDSYAYMLKDGVWNIVVKDIDGSWKSGSFNKQGRWCYDIKLSIPFNKPIDKDEIDKLPPRERPPQTFVMFEYAIPKRVSLASIENTHGFANNKGVWVLLTVGDQCKWEIAGGVVAYKLIKNRWVSMTFQSSFQKWVQSYDPLYTPITHFESTDSLDSRPPLRIALNENGVDKWKVIYQHSGFGFFKKDDLWLLMEKRCDGTWRKYEDNVLEYTGYKMVNSKWTRFKKTEGGEWICKESLLPSLPCDFSEHHDRLPPPTWNNLFLKDPRNTRENTSLTLASYAKFGFREENDVWVLMECDKSGVWKEHKIFFIQTDLYGYKNVGTRWKLMKKMQNGKWVEGKLEFSGTGGVVFVKEELTNPTTGSEKKEIKNNKTTTTGVKKEREVSVKGETPQGDEVKTAVKIVGGKETKGTTDVTRERTPEDSIKEEIGNVAKKRKLNGNKEDNQIGAGLQNEMANNNRKQNVEEVQPGNVEKDRVGCGQMSGVDSEKNKDKTEIEPSQPCEDGRVKDIKEEIEGVVENNKDVEKELDGGNEKDYEKKKGRPTDKENEQQDTRTTEQEIIMESEEKSDCDKQSYEIIPKKEIEDGQQGIKESQESTTENEEKQVKVENKQDYEKTTKEKIENDNDQQCTQNKFQGKTTKIEAIEKASKENNTDKNQNNNSYKIPITNPVQYHELTKMPVEDRPPKSVCLNIRGAPRRIPLVSKMSKIGFQHYNGVWVLLERLSGVWRILHNSSGLPLAYKLIDNRWVSMRTDKNGCWIPTFNPATTPRTYFDTEGPDDAKPPRRIVMEENGRIGWKEIGEFCGFGFLKNDDVWVLMKKITSNNWATYKNDEQESFGFKVQDAKWTKFKKRPEGSWEMVVDDLPVLHYDFTSKSDATPPEFTSYLQKRTGKELTNVGFRKVDGAWVFMEREESDAWIGVSDNFGFVRATGELWNVVERGENGQWIAVKSRLQFESAFDHAFPVRVKRERECLDYTPNKKIKIEPISPATSEHIDVKRESIERDSSSVSSPEKSETSPNDDAKSYPTEISVETSSQQVLQVKTTDISSKTDINNHQTSKTDVTPLLNENERVPHDNSCTATEVNSSIPNSSSCPEDKVLTTAEDSKIDTTPMGEEREEKKMDESNSAISKSSKEENNLRTNNKPDDENNEDPKLMKNKQESTSAIPKDEEPNRTIEPSNVLPSVTGEDPQTTQTEEELDSANPKDTDERPDLTNQQQSNGSPSVNQDDLETTQNNEELNSAIPKDTDKKPNETNKQASNGSPSVNRDLENTKNKEESNSAIPKETDEKLNKTNEQPSTTQNKEKLNCVEMYLALKPDCCLGCPELQNLLRKFRPANVPNKILRKKFRLPDGSFRMLSIPKALPVGQASSADQELKSN